MSLISSLQPFSPSFAAMQGMQSTGGTGFDALLASFGGDTPQNTRQSGSTAASIFNVNIFAFADNGDPMSGLIDTLISKIQSTLQSQSASSAETGYPLSPEFQATFGNSGPLIDWIKVITAQLGLTSEKNLALQNIAVDNKDATKSVECVQKIAKELQDAGIGLNA